MDKVIVFGIGYDFFYHKKTIFSNYIVVGLVDNSPTKQGLIVNEFAIKSITDFSQNSYDNILVTCFYNEIKSQLLSMGIPEQKIKNLNKELKFLPIREIKISLTIVGGIGDYLICRKWLTSVINKFQLNNFLLDIYVQERSLKNAENAFSGFVRVNKFSKLSIDSFSDTSGYDLISEFCIFPYIKEYDGRKIASTNVNFYKYLCDLQDFGYKYYPQGFCHNTFYYESIRVLFEKINNKYHCFYDVLGNLNSDDNFGFTLPIRINEEDTLRILGLNNCKYITLNTGLHREYKSFSQNTRAWNIDSWIKLSKLIKEKIPSLKVVQIGYKVDDYTNINADIDLSGKTSFEEIKVIMKNATVHVDYDGGLVHVRHIVCGMPSIVLFGPSDKKWHSYNENISIQTNACDKCCEWTSEQWLTKCPKGYDYPICMKSISPELVLQEVKLALKKIGR